MCNSSQNVESQANCSLKSETHSLRQLTFSPPLFLCPFIVLPFFIPSHLSLLSFRVRLQSMGFTAGV